MQAKVKKVSGLVTAVRQALSEFSRSASGWARSVWISDGQMNWPAALPVCCLNLASMIRPLPFA